MRRVTMTSDVPFSSLFQEYRNLKIIAFISGNNVSYVAHAPTKVFDPAMPYVEWLRTKAVFYFTTPKPEEDHLLIYGGWDVFERALKSICERLFVFDSAKELIDYMKRHDLKFRGE